MRYRDKVALRNCARKPPEVYEDQVPEEIDIPPHYTPYSAPEQPNAMQCGNCRLIDTRGCMYHGYPSTEIPPFCQYKIGVSAEEALRNLNGTFIDVLTPEHDAAVRKDEREKVLVPLLNRCKVEELNNKRRCDAGVDNITSFQLRARQGAFERCAIWIEESLRAHPKEPGKDGT